MAKNENWLELRQGRELGVTLQDSIVSTSDVCKKFLGSFVEWNRVKELCLPKSQNELRV
jgi:hypothetical protein